LSLLGVVLVAEPLVLPDGVDGGVVVSLPDGVAGAMLPVPDGVDGVLMLPLVPLVEGEAGAGGVLLGVDGADVDGDGEEEDGEGLDVSLLLQPYTMVSAAAANAIEIGLRIICETYDGLRWMLLDLPWGRRRRQCRDWLTIARFARPGSRKPNRASTVPRRNAAKASDRPMRRLRYERRKNCLGL
jgi:hypothetical protein